MKITSLVPITLFFVLLIGCGQGQNPTQPPPQQPLATAARAQDTGLEGHMLWGFWQGAFDPETGKIELASLRETQFHVNVTGQLQAPHPAGLKIAVNSFDPLTASIDINLTVTHPFPMSNFRGFDVRGIVMGTGNSIKSKLDPGIVYPASTGLRIQNADGYTRWWNAVEFTTPGLYGFTSGALGFKTFSPKTTLNPYKYYADPLSATDPIVPKVNASNRGTFSTDGNPPSLTRNYKLVFPKDGTGKPIWLFQYAIDASWAQPGGDTPKPKAIEDYPIKANCPEAFCIKVDPSGSTAYYVDDQHLGGDLQLAIEVFDWGAPFNSKGIDGEIDTIWVESPTLFNSIISVDVTSTPGSQPNSGIYHVTIPDVHPTGSKNQEVLVTVRSSNPATYAPPASGPAFPSSALLSAYNLVAVAISNEAPADKLTVEVPNGGEAWQGSTAEDIVWTSSGDIGDYVKIEYKVGTGDPATIVNSTSNDGSYSWDPIPNIDSDQVKVCVSSVADPSIYDYSDDYFTISASVTPQITVISPNGGECWIPGDPDEIKWSSVGAVGSAVKIQYTVGAGSPVTIVNSTNNDGSYMWDPVPSEDSDQVKVIITSVANPSIYDDSDDYFTISPGVTPQITVISPNGGECWTAGDPDEIKWSSVGTVGSAVKIEYTIGAGSPVTIVDSTDNDGSYMWDPVPNEDSDQVKVIISSVSNPSITDSSDDYFTIEVVQSATITVLVPNGGQVWQADTSREITWTTSGNIGDNVKIQYTIADGSPVSIINSTANDGSYIWNPVADVDSNQVRIVITSLDFPTITDSSDGYFTIVTAQTPTITVLIPNGGQNWQAGSSKAITWTSSGDIGDYVKIDYKVGGNSPVAVILSTANDGSYMWNPVADVDSNQVKIIITSIANPSVYDYSDNYFTISPATTEQIQVLVPNGGEIWQAGGSEEISWSSTGDVGSLVKIQYQIGSNSPVSIVNSTSNDGSYMWNPIAGIESTQVKVIITSTSNPIYTDSSDSYFTVTSSAGMKDITFRFWVATDYDESWPYYSGPYGDEEFSGQVAYNLKYWTNDFWNQYGVNMIDDGYFYLMEDVLPDDHTFFILNSFAEADEMHSYYGQYYTPDALNVYFVQELPDGYDTAYTSWPDWVDTLAEMKSEDIYVVISPTTWYWEEVMAHEGGHAFGALIDEYYLQPWNGYYCQDLYDDAPSSWQQLYCDDSGAYEGNLMYFAMGWDIFSYDLTSGQHNWVHQFHLNYPNNW